MEPVPSFEFNIPSELLKEFKSDPRFVVRPPWIVGIPAPELLLKPEYLQKVKEAGFEVVLVPMRVTR